jgi:hypothetical protein
MEKPLDLLYSFTLGTAGPRVQLVLEDEGELLPITPVQHSGDVFFLAPDSRVIAALVQVAEQRCA